MSIELMKAKAAGSKKSLTMWINGALAAAGAALSNFASVLYGVSDAVSIVAPHARDYLLQFQSIIDPRLSSWIGGTLTVIGILNMILRARTSQSLESKATPKPDPEKTENN